MPFIKGAYTAQDFGHACGLLCLKYLTISWGMK